LAKVKGTTLYGRLKYVRSHHGEAPLDRVLAELPDQDMARNLRLGAIRSEWYPFETLVSLIEAIDRVCGKGDGALFRPMAAQIAEDDLKTVYKAFFRIASPGYIITKASHVWQQYYDAGELVILKNEPNAVDLEIRKFPTPNRTHCESISGWIERCIAMTGAASVLVSHPECRAEGRARCIFEARWS
jgi:hypothetical protein